MKYLAEVDGLVFPVEILDERHVRFGDQVLTVDLSAVSGQPLYSLLVNGESYEGYVYTGEDGWQVILRGSSYTVSIEDEREKNLKTGKASLAARIQEYILRAPMPGLIIDVPVANGSQVEQGDILVVLESMKMQNELRSPVSGTVTAVKTVKGDSVELKQVLMQVSRQQPQ